MKDRPDGEVILYQRDGIVQAGVGSLCHQCGLRSKSGSERRFFQCMS